VVQQDSSTTTLDTMHGRKCMKQSWKK